MTRFAPEAAPPEPDTARRPPTQTMRVILQKLEECGGRLVPRHNARTGKLTGAYEIDGYCVMTWFPQWAVKGIIDRGLIDSLGKINDRERAALRERY